MEETMKTQIKVLNVLMILAVALLLGAPTARAMEVRGGDVVVIAANEVINDDLYVTATAFTLDGTVKGDLIVFARTVQINGTVEGDVMGAAQAVSINGTVKDDARVAGAVITLGPNGRIADDLLVAGGTVETKPGSQVGGDLSGTSSQALLAGNIERNLSYGGVNLSLQGRIGGNALANVSGASSADGVQPWMFQSFMPDMPAWPAVPVGLTLGDQANIGGKLDYTSPQPISVPAGVAHEVKFTPMPVNTTDNTRIAITPAPYTVGAWLLDQLRSLVALAVIGLLLIWLLPTFFNRATQQLAAKPWPSLGWGFIVAIMVPVGAVVLFIAAILVAIALGWLTLGNLGGSLVVATMAAVFSALVAFGLAVAYVTKIVVAHWLGQWVLGKLSPNRAPSPVMATLIGLVPVVLLTGIPTLGALIGFVIALLGLGALWLMWQRTSAPMLAPSLPPAQAASSATPTQLSA
jgi:cytoskeletal protein CcmA (bactofilin family)